MLVIGVAACTRGGPPPEAADAADPSAATVNPAIWPRVPSAFARDAALEARIEEILGRLSLEEKVGQVIQADVASVTPEDVRRYRLGSVLNGGNSGPGGNDLAPAAAWLAAADEFYLASMDTSEGHEAIPILWGTDAVHGHSNIIGATLFPHNIGLGATRNPALIRRIGEITAREIRVTGQDWTFAPTLAVARDVRWGRSYESFSERAEIVREYAAALVEGLQGVAGSPQFLRPPHVIATAKHFVGDGGTHEGRDQGDALVSEEILRDLHAAGYPPAIAAGVQSVMASFSSWQGVKLHGHRGLLTDVLKGRMGFDGPVIGDWNGHSQVPGCSATSCAAALAAGLDIFMAPDSWEGLYHNTLEQVRSGVIAQERLDDAVRRVLRLKLRAGLFELGKPSERPGAGEFSLLGAPAHRAVARQAVRESLVLLKNRGGILPLHPRQHVLVAGDGANDIAKQSGGWTLSWQGTGLTNEHFPNAESIFAGIEAHVTAAGGRAVLSEDGRFETRPDVAVVVFGEEPYAEFQGDIETLEYRPGDTRDLDLLRRLRAADIPVVAVFLSGRPLWVNREINAADAFVAAWLPGSEGGGIADVLFRDVDGSIRFDFKGKLSFSWPRDPLQAPTADSAEPPLFPYGYGLTYADDGAVPQLSEHVPQRDTRVNARTYFTAGRPAAGWELFVAEGTERIPLASGTGASATAALRVVALDRNAQEDARLGIWSGDGTATLGIARAAPIDLQRESNGQLALTFHYLLESAPGGPVELAVECGPGCRGVVPIVDALRDRPLGQWQRLKIPLHCFERGGADMRRVQAPFTITARGPLRLAFAEIGLTTGLDDALTCSS